MVEEPLLEVRDSRKAARERLAGARSSGRWDEGEFPEPRIHRIHAYPAKFPAFITTKALAHARSEGLSVERVADLFCGCGTVAYEARRAGLQFWGCDINPVATLIARVKSGAYDPKRFAHYAERVDAAFPTADDEADLSPTARRRLAPWYRTAQFNDLARLLNAIRTIVPANSTYRDAFHCAFSAILKGTSQWRARATKPALDSTKTPADVRSAFTSQCALMNSAWVEGLVASGPTPQIQQGNVLTIDPPDALMDLVITSPPYVTSYEYADLHQLSILWLGYAADHREMRRGSIGTSQHDLNFAGEFKKLNRVGTQVAFSLYSKDPAAACSVAKYYLDMQAVARRCREFLSPKGMAFFVIGNTQYRGTRIDNASHLAESLFDAGFRRVRATKRTPSNKMHTPFRNSLGQLSTVRTGMEIYSEEYILIAER